MSNKVHNSTAVTKENVQLLPLAPAPIVQQILNTSFTVLLTLEEMHMDITAVYIEVYKHTSFEPCD